MNQENPGMEMFRKEIIIMKGGNIASKMRKRRESLSRMNSSRMEFFYKIKYNSSVLMTADRNLSPDWFQMFSRNGQTICPVYDI